MTCGYVVALSFSFTLSKSPPGGGWIDTLSSSTKGKEVLSDLFLLSQWLRDLTGSLSNTTVGSRGHRSHSRKSGKASGACAGAGVGEIPEWLPSTSAMRLIPLKVV